MEIFSYSFPNFVLGLRFARFKIQFGKLRVYCQCFQLVPFDRSHGRPKSCNYPIDPAGKR